MLKATVILKLDGGDKTLVKEHNDQKVLEEWIYTLSRNSRFYMGSTDNGQFAVRAVSIEQPSGAKNCMVISMGTNG
jgi:hypothetical protein